MSGAVRQVPGTVVFKVALTGLGRIACIYGHPARDEHNHADCIRDDDSYAADLGLALLAAVSIGDETKALDHLTKMLEATKQE